MLLSVNSIKNTTAGSWVWRNTELHRLRLPFSCFLNSDDPKKLKKTLFNHIVRNVVDVWHKVNKYLNGPSFLSRFSLIWGYNYFRPGRADAGFDIWADKRVKQIKDIFDRSGNFLTFEGLINKFVV